MTSTPRIRRLPFAWRNAPLPLASLALCIVCLTGQGHLSAQAPAGDAVATLLVRLQQSLNAPDETALASLFDSTISPDRLAESVGHLRAQDSVRRVLRELDRAPIENVPPAEGQRVVVEIFEEWAGRARVLIAGLTVGRSPDGTGPWRILRTERLNTFEGLFRLRIDVSRQYEVQNLVIVAPDLRLTLKDGALFLIESDEGAAGVVLLGRGEMQFSPTPETERGQLRQFAGSETLVTPFDSVLIRVSPLDYPRFIPAGALRSVAVDRELARRASELADRELPKALTVDLREVSGRPWHLLPREGDVLAEIRTRRYGTLTFSRFGTQAEDIALIDRERRLTIALYPSQEKLATQSRFYSDDTQREYDVIDYNIEASISPPRSFMRARARLAIRARNPLLTMTLRLSDALTVTGVTSVETGPLSYLRLRNQNAVVVRLPRVLAPEGTLTLLVTYSGLVRNQELDTEALQIGFELPPNLEPHLLLSSASYWYPQNPFTDFATATMRIIVPEGFACVGSGEPVIGDDSEGTLRSLEAGRDERTYVFRAAQPLRYLALVASRFTRVAERTLTIDAGRRSIALAVEANPLQRARARELVEPFADMVRYYASVVGDAPFPSATLALVESQLPGGHSPGYFVMLNSPAAATSLTWQNDPAAFQGFPEFFLAHEVAHQWWGQAIGGKNYHERWLSEGFAQYFAALYAEESRGERVFHDMLRQFRRWSLSQSSTGPVYLGHRLGQIQGGRRAFRALVYNKAASVLHMLRRLVGDEVFFSSLRRFYHAHKFQSAGTDDLQRAFEAESGRSLERFFERWIYGAEIPRVVDRSMVVDGRGVVRLEQRGERVFDLPVTVTLSHEDGTTSDVLVVMSDRRLEQTIESAKRVRQLQINRDSAALAEFER